MCDEAGLIDPVKATGSPKGVLGVFREVRDEIKVRFTDSYKEGILPTI